MESLLRFLTIFVIHIEGLSPYIVTWPAEKYGLPMASSGCPTAKGFSWETGYVYQDLENNSSRTTTSSSFHLRAAVVNSNDIIRGFCMKTTKSSTVDLGRPPWPHGNYCIYKKSINCPTGLSPGWVLWDDENGQNGINLNVKNGSVPKGLYNRDTRVSFCCQTVGSIDDPIELPIDEPFYLIAYRSKRCQEVLKTIHTVEFIRFDTEHDKNHDNWGLTHPFGVDSQPPEIYYCYYKACRWTLSDLNGTFWSPNYPNEYKNKAWCEWHINVRPNYIIALTFEDFRLEDVSFCQSTSCDCDYVEVRETSTNGTSSLIGKYCMGNAYPWGEIKSRGNNMTVVFRSNYWKGEPGFKARYRAIQVSGTTTKTSTSPRDTSTRPTRVAIGKWTKETKRPATGSSSHHNFTKTNKPTTLITTGGLVASSYTTNQHSAEGSLEVTETTGNTGVFPSTEPESLPTHNTIKEAGVHQGSKNGNLQNGNMRLAITVITSSMVTAGLIAVAVMCFYRRRSLKRTLPGQENQIVTFTARQNPNEDASKIMSSNIYARRASTADSIDNFVVDDEFKESDNPLYSSSVEAEQDNSNIIYESMDEISATTCVMEAESYNPVYEGLA
ncbi:uncharacterized protein LOC141896933 [Acropora palmata]|uniref:uncharacterized protein LOC141896933 n=1 Tax=Acropora palmata TaxID=6131 RepID=UPI003DA1AA0D